ncbi:hypothetical protein HZH66_000004 [Vespula vulgaris]|uniref:Uncharacterized protein n=1 Tax=Vespula vulgaris TaxID=7454 RepID=A0A834NKS8_VESVU|nr:hypothetical protein HZH66_000004 [Vespula vulgaris]
MVEIPGERKFHDEKVERLDKVSLRLKTKQETGLGCAGLDWAELGSTGQNRTEQDRTGQDRGVETRPGCGFLRKGARSEEEKGKDETFCSSHDSKIIMRLIIEDLDEELEMKNNGDE